VSTPFTFLRRAPFRYLYEDCGKDLLEPKLRCIENCAKVGMGITLVVVVSPNINQDRIGEIIQFAKSKIPTVKGIHFQPLTTSDDIPSTG